MLGRAQMLSLGSYRYCVKDNTIYIYIYIYIGGVMTCKILKQMYWD